jgi:hypothetical protein
LANLNDRVWSKPDPHFRTSLDSQRKFIRATQLLTSLQRALALLLTRSKADNPPTTQIQPGRSLSGQPGCGQAARPEFACAASMLADFPPSQAAQGPI